MDLNTRQRLSLLLLELEEIDDLHQNHFGFGVFVRVKAGRKPSWKMLDQCREVLSHVEMSAPIQPSPWLEPSSNDQSCVRWWGNLEGVDKFRKWIFKFISLLGRTTIPSLTFTEDVPTAIASLTEQTAKIESLAASIIKIELDGAVFFDVQTWAVRFVRKIADVASGGILGFRPRLEVHLDPDSSAITFDGKTTLVDAVPALILHKLMEARGDWRTRKDMQENSPLLAEEKRLDRYINKLIETHRIPIESERRGYRLPTDLFLPPESIASPFGQVRSGPIDKVIQTRPPREGETGLQLVEE